MSAILRTLFALKNFLIVTLTPILLSPILFALGGQEASCAYVIVIMAVFWVTEALPISVTALLPVFKFPLAGVLSASDVGKVFFNDTTLMFIGGMMVAIAIEQWNIHKRIALLLLVFLGSKPIWLMLGIMIPTWFLSMWISNTATTSMMLPIANAILLELKGTGDKKTDEEDQPLSIEMEDFKVVEVTPHGHVNEHHIHHVNNNTEDAAYAVPFVDRNRSKVKIKETISDETETPEWSRLAKALSLCIAYAANIGGTGSMIGSTPNLVLKGQIDKVYEELGKESPLTFTSWLAFGVPTSFFIMLLAWFWLQTFYLRCSIWTSVCRKGDDNASRIKEVIREQYRKLGPVSFGQVVVSIHFLALAILWITRDFGGNYGWAHAFKDKFIRDSVPGLLVGCSLFIFPSSLVQIVSSTDSGSKPLLSWKMFSTKMPWGIVFLLGGGYSMAKASQASGLSDWISSQLNAIDHLKPSILILVTCFILATLTEVTSNAATTALFLPILSNLAISVGVDPLYVMFPATIASSFAFMLPVATPSNAVIFSYGYIKVIDMAKCGLVLNIIAILVLIASTETLGRSIFGFEPLSTALIQNFTTQIIN